MGPGLRSGPTQSTAAGDRYPATAAFLGDVDADGYPDFALGGLGRTAWTGGPASCPIPYAPSRLDVVSGLTGAVLHSTPSVPVTNLVVAAAGDVNADGVPDMAARSWSASPTGPAAVIGMYHGRTGAILHLFAYPAIGSPQLLTGFGDYDQDGRDDILISGGLTSTLLVISGANAGTLATFSNPPPSGGLCCLSRIADLTGDGLSEIAAGTYGYPVPYLATFVHVFSVVTLPSASLAFLGPGCDLGSQAPGLVFSGPPRLGSTLSLFYMQGTPGASGAILAGPLPPAPLVLGPGCLVYPDLSVFYVVAWLTLDNSGSWATTIPLPVIPAAAGLEVVVQGFALPVLSPSGVELTDGWRLRIGV